MYSEAMADVDQELLRQGLGGDAAAFSAVYRARQSAVFRFALQMTGDESVAEDTTQETFLALLDGRAKFDATRGSLPSFLYGVARNILLRRLERDGRHTELDDDWPGGGDALEDLTRAESVERVREAVLSLPVVYREAVVLCDLGEASYDDAAAAIGCPVGTVRSRLSRARAMLAKKLEPRGNYVRG